MTAPWVTIPEAAELLASCAIDPPKKKGFTYAFGDHDIRYSDKRVSRLRQIHKAEAERLYDAADYPAWEAHVRYDEQHAIAEVIGGVAERRRAA